MTARLQRIHAILRAGNVPCALDARPGVGVVLLAGTPDSGAWDVLIHDTGGQLWVQGARGMAQLPTGLSDAGAADAVKLLVVQAWADQGDREAQNVLARMGVSSPTRSGAANPATNPWTRSDHLAPIDMFALFDPLEFAGRMIDAATQMAEAFLTPPRTMVTFAMWSPWGMVQSRHTRR